MAGPLADATAIVIVGVNHRTAKLGLRDRLFVEDSDIASVLDALPCDIVPGAVPLSTCDRVEIVAVGADGDVVANHIREVLRQRASDAGPAFDEAYYVLAGDDAVRHLFRVAASLESQVVGEPQVLGQVKVAHRLARSHGRVPPFLEGLFQAAYNAAKQVRSETAIAERPVSIATVAAQAARDIHGDLADRHCLVIGDGDMAITIGESLMTRGLNRLAVTHPRVERAQGMADSLNAHLMDFTELAGALVQADVVVSAYGRRDFVISGDMIRGALARRGRRPMMLIDLGMPGDVDPAVERLDDAFLFDLNDLDAMAARGAASRETELPKAAIIIQEAVELFTRRGVERSAVPALVHLRRHVERLREAALKDAAGDAERATRLFANRLLHGPSVRLRELAVSEDPETLQVAERLLERLFTEYASDHQNAGKDDAKDNGAGE